MKILHITFVLLMSLTVSSQLIATPFDRLVMPGKLISAHEKYEIKCDNCHEPFKKAKQNNRCLVCHKAVNTDIKQQQGFHGIDKNVLDKECKFCHTDHAGREADIVNFNQHTFDHNITDFPLKAAHQAVACNVCHLANKKYREAKHLCIKCHEANDIHNKRLGKACGDCHRQKNWLKGKFDHEKTKYKLSGKHQNTACKDCHPNQRYQSTPSLCIACHQLQDVHHAEYGAKCEKCHTTEKWKKILFDHDKDTKFKLRFRHAKVKCSSCHKGDIFKKSKLIRVCVSCHQSDDRHHTRYGKKCAECHVQEKWSKINFDHQKDAKYKLVDTHEEVECNACHRGDIYKDKLKKECVACHLVDDVHNGSQGKDCLYCHNQMDWSNKIIFEHDLTKFPLIGLHSLVACEACHKNSEYKMKKVSCNDCHEQQDIHKAKLTRQCVLCHNPNGWRQWTFLHNEQSDYRLDGAHADLDCLSCHKNEVQKGQKIMLSDKCVACHEDDDVHAGQFGKRCEKCHKTTKFNQLTIMN